MLGSFFACRLFRIRSGATGNQTSRHGILIQESLKIQPVASRLIMELMNSLDLAPISPHFFLCRSLRSFFLTVIRIFRSPRGVLTADKFVILPAERMEGRRKRDSLLLLLRPSWIQMRDEDHYDEIFPLSDLLSGWGREINLGVTRR